MEFSYTLDRHLQYRIDENAHCHVTVGECHRKPRSPIEEAVDAAREIQRAADGRTIWLCMSGGVDSEAMAHAFLEASVPFRAAIMKFELRLNWFDIKYAVRYCCQRGIPYTVFPFKVLDFLQSARLAESGERYRCRSPQFAVHFELLEKLKDGVPILPWQPLSFIPSPGGRHFLGLPEDHYFAYQRFFEVNHRPGVPYFFLYTPELIYSFLRLPLMQKAIFEKDFLRPDHYALKIYCYREGGFPICARADKWTGFELVKRYFSNPSNRSESVFENRFRSPLEKTWPLPSQTIFQFSKTFLKVTDEL